VSEIPLTVHQRILRLAEWRWRNLGGASRSRSIGPEDISQEALLRLWRQFYRVDREPSDAFVALAVRNAARDLFCWRPHGPQWAVFTSEVAAEERGRGLPAQTENGEPGDAVALKHWAGHLAPRDQSIAGALALSDDTERTIGARLDVTEGRISQIVTRLRAEAERSLT
jgi:DNA-directed RNA polymerase specialized sigma24 family protein